ncbi:4-hydroxybenzoate--CoA ligase [Desulfofundulus kuznetsovii DSM 6115]|uniref:4-hydroxybenzoate--CoA ligase n=1 Tax=Desulfofundulus kuznetsovii (strain DSM 6115 / VKM B-1805 / 17) TaxID=760568 RepID=A0AAU8PEA2_DESK7|nr:4-hydroxybenzoate--CoA ligase [Desulfofundulus kuznetsovii DSM 6115]
MRKVILPDNVIGPSDYLPEKIFTLPELTRYPYNINLADYLVGRSAARYPDKVAIYYKDTKITYRQLWLQVNRLANGLRSIGLGEFDRIMLMGTNCPEWIIANMACWKIGAIPVLVNHLVKYDEIIYRATDSGAKAIICSVACLNEVEKADLPSLKKIVYGGKADASNCVAFEELIREQSDTAPSASTTLDHVGRLIYSSGTTGRPKGIISTVHDILAATDTHGRYVLKIKENDILGGHPYFSFAFGSVNFTFYPWRFGASISIIERFEPEEMFHTIENHGVTMLFCVPTAFNMMLNVSEPHEECMKTVRLCQSAGEPLNVKTYKEWKKRYNVEIINSLGSGDLMYWLSTYEGMPEEKIGSVGTTVPGFANKVVGEDFSELPRGKPGELLVKGPCGQVYWNKPEKQVNAVWQGWNRPGLYMYQDEDGFFWYLSRTDDIIVTSGYKIPCGEVENALNQHPAVLESAVVPSPDPVRGSIIKAFVVLNEGFDPSPELENELRSFVKEKIEDYKSPRKIVFARADELPRTTTGKIQRNVLREREEKQNNL